MLFTDTVLTDLLTLCATWLTESKSKPPAPAFFNGMERGREEASFGGRDAALSWRAFSETGLRDAAGR
jgi:hypothetical protein